MFEKNVDGQIEFQGLENIKVGSLWPDYAATVADLKNVDRDSDVVSEDELRSYCGSSNEDSAGGEKRGQTKHTIFNEKTDMINPMFKKGMEFKTHGIVEDAVKEYSIKEGLQTRFLECGRENVRVLCKESCPWELYASYVKSEGLSRIKTFIDTHTCTRTYNVPWVSTNWIVDKYKDRIQRNLTWLVSSLHDTIQAEWTVNLDRQKVSRAKKRALK